MTLNGNWSLKVALRSQQGGTGRFELAEGEDGAVTGAYTGALGSQSVTGTVKGRDVELGFDSQVGRVTYRGTISGDKMEGTCVYGQLGEGTFEGTRSGEPAGVADGPAAGSALGTRTMLADAGRLVDRHSMVWMRRLDVPVERVWDAVSTIEGLNQWWLPTRELELRPGGRFLHHWESRVNALEQQEYIDFGDVTFSGAGMRFELKTDGEGTVFSFLDNWGEEAEPPPGGAPWQSAQPGGRGTPWSGVAAGWHSMIDALETHLTGKTFEHSGEELARFYAGYLSDCFRWLELMPAKREAEKQRSA